MNTTSLFRAIILGIGIDNIMGAVLAAAQNNSAWFGWCMGGIVGAILGIIGSIIYDTWSKKCR